MLCQSLHREQNYVWNHLMESMADTTQSTMNLGSTTEDVPPSVINDGTRNYHGYLSKPYADYDSSQKLEIELH